MKKITLCIALLSLILSACSSDESALSDDEKLIEDFAADIETGSKRDILTASLSAETARCMAEASIPFMNKELLSEKVDSPLSYQIDDLALHDNSQEKTDDALAARIRCLTDEEFTTQIENEFRSNFDISGSCMAEKLVDGNGYADALQSPDGGVAQITAYAQECQSGLATLPDPDSLPDTDTLVVE